jgi:hypothetical protein
VVTAISEKLIYIIRLAQYAGVDFHERVQRALWEHGCDVIDDGSYMNGPRELILQADDLAEDLACVGIDAAPAELRELGERLESGGVLEISENEASVLAAVRDALTARSEIRSADGERGNG